MLCSRHLATATLLLAGITSVHASFELMYLQDATTGRITRWDPVNKINLGHFGYPDGSITFETVSAQVGSHAYIGGASGSRTFDPNTNTLVATQPTFQIASSLTPSGNYLMGLNLSSCWKYTTGYGGLTAVAGSMSSRISVIPIDDNRAWLTGISSDGSLAVQLINFSTGTSGTVQTLVAASGLSASSSIFGMGARVVAQNGTKRLVLPYINQAGLPRLAVSTIDAGDSLVAAPAISSSVLSFSSASALSIMPAHDGYWVVGDDQAAGSTRFQRYESGGYLVSNYTSSSIDVPTSRWHGSNLVAPEPGALASVGTGVLGLLLRRRRST